MPPDPNVGAWVGAISAVRAGVGGAVFSAPTLALDTASFTISYDTTGPGGVRQIKIVANPAAAPTFTDIIARSLVLGAGYSGQTNLDVTGAALFRGKVTFAGGTSGVLLPPVNQPPIAPGDAGKVVIFRAPLASAVTILSITFTSAQILTADDTIFDTCQIHDFSSVGVDAGYVEAQSFFTGLTGAQHTGDWAVGVDAFTWTPMGGYVLAAGHRLLAIWDCTNGGGTEIFSGSAWTIVT